MDDPTPTLDPPDTSEWLMHAQVARRIGRSVTTVRKMREEGQIPAVLDNGVYKFDPQVVERIALELGVGQGSIPDNAKLMAMHAESTMATVVDSVLANNQRLFEQMFKLIDRAHAYIEKLEDVTHRQREAAESALTQEHDRELARKKAEHLERVREKALEALSSQFLPMVLARYGVKAAPASNGSNGSSSSSPIPDAMKAQIGEQVLTMLATLDADQVAKLKDVLPAEQWQMIANLHGVVKAA